MIHNIITARNNGESINPSSIFDKVVSGKKTSINEAQNIENELVLPLIDSIQKIMISEGYYSEKYSVHNIINNQSVNCSVNFTWTAQLILFVYLLIVNLINLPKSLNLLANIIGYTAFTLRLFQVPNEVHTNTTNYKCNKVIHYKKYVDKQITLELYHYPQVKTSLAIIKDEIHYASGKLFYSGTLYGNKFGSGKFYYEDGTLMYEKLN